MKTAIHWVSRYTEALCKNPTAPIHDNLASIIQLAQLEAISYAAMRVREFTRNTEGEPFGNHCVLIENELERIKQEILK